MQLIDYFLNDQKLSKKIKLENNHQKKIHLLNELSKTRFTIIQCLIIAIIIFVTLVAILISSYPNIPTKAAALLIISLFYLLLPFFYKYNGNDFLLRFLALAAGLVGVSFRALAAHGISSATFYWLILIPLCTALVFEKKMIYWSLAATIIASFIIFNGEKLGFFLGPAHSPLINYIAFLGLLVAISFTAISFDRQSTNFQNQIVEMEKKFQDTKKLASLGNMAAGVAHEINNPLMIIAGNLQHLERSVGQLNLDQEDFLKINNNISKASNNISRINNIIQSLLSYSHMQSKDSFKDFSLNNFMTDLQIIIKDEDRIHKIDWINNAKSSGSNKTIVINGDYTLLTQVFTNLIYNAWHATREREDFKITVHCELKENFVEFHIIDQGKIIDAKVIENMFHPFFTTKPIGQGTGLGLSLSKGIIELHQGELYYDQSYSTSCFVLKLPYTLG